MDFSIDVNTGGVTSVDWGGSDGFGVSDGLALDDFAVNGGYGPGANNSATAPGAGFVTGAAGSSFNVAGAILGGLTGLFTMGPFGAVVGVLSGGYGSAGKAANVVGNAFGNSARGEEGGIGRPNSATGSPQGPSTPSDSGPTVSDTSNPARPLTQPPTLIPQSQQPSTPAPVPETSVLPDSSVPTPSQAAQEQEAEFERVEQQAKEDERRRRAALRAYLNPTGPSGLRARPLVGRPRLLGD